MAEMIRVEVVYAEPQAQTVVRLEVETGTTVTDAIEASGIREQLPGMDFDPGRVGVFGRKAPLDQVLNAGDRVELYRPLLADPKEVRRARAEAAKAASKKA